MMRRMLVVLILLVAGVALPASAQEAAQRIAAAERLLERLIETYGVSGHEDAVRELIRSELPAWAKPEVDTAGNLWVRAGTGGAPVVILEHMDEIGSEITAILDDGTLALAPRGGMFASGSPTGSGGRQPNSSKALAAAASLAAASKRRAYFRQKRVSPSCFAEEAAEVRRSGRGSA